MFNRRPNQLLAAGDMPAALALGSRYRTLTVPTSPTTIPYDATTPRAAVVPKTYLTKDIFVRLTGTLIVGTNPATVAAGIEAPLGLLQQIELLGDDNETVWRISGRDAFRLAQIFHAKASELVPPAATVGTNAFSASFILSAEAVGMAVPVDSYLDLREFEQTSLRITWGAATDIATAGGGGTIAIGATTQLECYVNQTTEGLNSIGFRRSLLYQEIDVTATNTDLAVLTPRAGLLAGILFHSTRDKLNVDDIVNDILIESDTSHSHVKRRTWASIQFENVQRYQLDSGTLGGRISGYAFHDFTEDGRLAAALNTEAMNELRITMSVTFGSGVQKVRLNYVFFKPLRRAVAA